MAINDKDFYASHGLDFDYKNMLDEYIKGVINQAKIEVLTEIQLEIEELDSRAGYSGDGMPTFSTDYIRKKKVNELIQQKINALKGDTNDSKNSIGDNPCCNC